MRVVGERTINKLVKDSLHKRKPVIHKFHRWGYDCKLSVEKYRGEITFGLTLLHDIYEETNYIDISMSKELFSDIHSILLNLYKICEIGIFVQVGMFQNEISKSIGDEQLFEFFNVSYEEFEVGMSNLEGYKYNKKVLTVRGVYFGDVIIKFLYSEKINKITHIIAINPINV